MVNYAMVQLGVDKAKAENYVETYDGMKAVAASITSVLGAATSKIDSFVAKYATNNQLLTGKVFDSIKAIQPGSVIPQSFEMFIPNGQKSMGSWKCYRAHGGVCGIESCYTFP